MSKKHFIAIAKQISIQLENQTCEVTRAAVIETANRLCDVFADENPRFDRVRFLAACGINR